MNRSILCTAFLLASTALTLTAQTTPTVPSFELAYSNLQLNSEQNNILAGDFNNDGKPDVIVQGGAPEAAGTSASTSEDGISLLLGNGNGTFAAPVVIGTASALIQTMAVADFNKDGNLDVIAFEDNNTFQIFYGNGNGTFQAPVSFPTAAEPSSGTVGTFYNDGYIDVAVLDGSGNVEVFRNNGGKDFVLESTVTGFSGTNSVPEQISSGDLNDTGVDDLAVLTTDAAYVLWNNGSGAFSKVLLSSYPVNGTFAINVTDINQDGMADIAVTYSCNLSPTGGPDGSSASLCLGVDIFYGQGDNKTVYRKAVADSNMLSAGAVYAADVNGDGIADLVVSGYSDNSPSFAQGLFVFLGNPDGSFSQTPQIYNAGFDGDLAPIDLNRDGMIDFAEYGGSSYLEVYINGGTRGACQTSTINPTVNVCQPVNGTYLPSPVTVEANAYSTTKVTSMQEYIDNNLEYSKDNATSFDTSFPLSVGAHSLITKAWLSTGSTFRSDRTINVYSGTPYPACPTAPETATICLPSGTTSTSSVHILANSSTAYVPSAVQLYIDSKLVIDNTNPGTTYLDTNQTLSTGSHDLVFKLWDADGNVYTAQKTVTVN